MKEIINISLWIIALVLIIVGLSFANKNKLYMQLSKPVIDIDYNSENRFIDETDVLKEIIHNPQDTSKYLYAFDVTTIEERLKNNFAIRDAQVYKTVDGKIVAWVKQNRPIARVINHKNESFYMDEDGYLMSLSEKYTARLLVINGNVKPSYNQYYKKNLSQLDDSLATKTIIDELYQLAQLIDNSEFWKAQIEQVYVNKELEIELIPKVGNHIIVLGKPEHMEAKLNKLYYFYREGLSKTGWNEYSEINLSFNNQIVCKKNY
ncbi:MAG: hypothetical protein COA31_002845 [Flavobacteriales bacterium]|nr:hypothetical protein [Flavobacteriales bacterium]